MKIRILALILVLFVTNFQAFAAENATRKSVPVVTNDTSLTNHIREYKYRYLDTFIATLAVLSNSKLNITSYNTAKGEILASTITGKELYILVVSPQNNLTQVRITPADGVYDIPADTVKKLLDSIKLELTKY